jgi:hypothetical protein
VGARSTVIWVASVSVALFPSSAAAQRCSGEDVAAIDQYCELVPSVSGTTPPGSSSRTLRRMLPRSQRAVLERAGPSGHALLALAPGAPMRQGTGRVRLLPGAVEALSGRLAEPRMSVDASLRAIRSAASDDQGVGSGFRWILLLSTLGLVGTKWMRRTRERG